MDVWSQVKSIQNIDITVDDGQEASIIFGNGRNNVAITVTFNGLDSSGNFVDLRGVIVRSQVCLLNYGTGKIIDWAVEPQFALGQVGLVYAGIRGKFCNSTLVEKYIRDDETDTRASITHFLYGVCRNQTNYDIGALIKLADGSCVSTAKGTQNPHKVSITVKRPLRYRNSDLEPYSWQKIYQEGNYIQWVAHVALKRFFNTGWVYCEITNAETKDGELYFVSRTTRNRTTWFIYLAPLGKQKTYVTTLRSRHRVVYNHEHESFTVICVKQSNSSLDEVEGMTDHALIRLFDSFGNMGVFKLNYFDPTSPYVQAQNP